MNQENSVSLFTLLFVTFEAKFRKSSVSIPLYKYKEQQSSEHLIKTKLVIALITVY